jgi:hypothetical protein
MPLNIEDPRPGGPVRQDRHRVPEDPGKRKSILPWLFLILVLSSGVFLLFQFGILPPGKGRPVVAPVRPAQPAVVDTDAAHSTDTAVHVRIPPETPDPEPPVVDTGKRFTGEGGYTIVISAFHVPGDAEEMAGRWMKAGFEAGVQHAGGWYRVTLGHFRTVSEAREEAEQLKEAFEDGYWITRTNI